MDPTVVQPDPANDNPTNIPGVSSDPMATPAPDAPADGAPADTPADDVPGVTPPVDMPPAPDPAPEPTFPPSPDPTPPSVPEPSPMPEPAPAPDITPPAETGSDSGPGVVSAPSEPGQDPQAPVPTTDIPAPELPKQGGGGTAAALVVSGIALVGALAFFIA